MEAVKSLPFFLEEATDIDDDIVDFSLKGGWDMFDQLLPSVGQMSPTRHGVDWVKSLDLIAARLKVCGLGPSLVR